MIWKSSWQNSLAQALNQVQKRLEQPGEQGRLAIVGVGQELRGDDAAGIAVIRQLGSLASVSQQRNVCLIEGGNAPENHTGPLRRFAPHLILFIDMAQMDQEPGAVCWLPWQETVGLSASSHTMPLYMLARFLTADLQCDVALIGIQPADASLRSGLTAVVQAAVDAVVSGIAAALENF